MIRGTMFRLWGSWAIFLSVIIGLPACVAGSQTQLNAEENLPSSFRGLSLSLTSYRVDDAGFEVCASLRNDNPNLSYSYVGYDDRDHNSFSLQIVNFPIGASNPPPLSGFIAPAMNSKFSRVISPKSDYIHCESSTTSNAIKVGSEWRMMFLPLVAPEMAERVALEDNLQDTTVLTTEYRLYSERMCFIEGSEPTEITATLCD